MNIFPGRALEQEAIRMRQQHLAEQHARKVLRAGRRKIKRGNKVRRGRK